MTEAPERKRLVSLDAFRGLTVLGMLLVNNAAMGNATPATLRHAEWGGLSAADLVFPWFLLIVGVALPLSAAKSEGWAFVRRLFVRTGWLLVLGMLVDSAVARRPTVGLGVLQLIGLAYCVGALTIRLPPWGRGALAGTLLVAYHLLLKFVPVPGVPLGTVAETANAVRHLNDTVLGPFGLRGLPSVLPTAAMVLIGTVVGTRIRAGVVPLFLIGGGLAVVGGVWNLGMPLSKAIWTPSYIVSTAGLGVMLLSVLTLLDGKDARWAWPLVIAGANPIVAYVGPIFFKTLILQEWRMPTSDLSLEQGLQGMAFAAFGRTAGGWFYTLAFALVWWVFLATLYRRKLFIRV
ncbi:MAG: heparan-alpha-glucosaminide N-acetyltransferase domain-containing protein [Fimbriimonas sp.]